jgi:Flp pilus assembly protein TadD
LNTAIAELTRAIKKNPDYRDAYFRRGLAHMKKGDSARAEKDFLEVLRIDPSYYHAKADLENARAPRAAYLLFGEGNAAINAGKYDLALEKFNQAIALYPGYAGAYNYRGYVYSGKKMYDEAEADYEKAVELNPELAEAYYNLGILYRRRGEYDKAEQYLNRALAIYPAHTYAKVYLAEIVAMNTEKARKDAWDRRIAANPNPYPAPFNGQWKHVAPPRQVTGKTVTYTAYETNYEPVRKSRIVPHRRRQDGSPEIESYTDYEPVTREVTIIRTIPAFMLPELITIWEFDGSTYRKTEMLFVDDRAVLTKATLGGVIPLTPSEANGTIKREIKTGTFYYDGEQIELEDGTILLFVNGAISDDARNRYTKQ